MAVVIITKPTAKMAKSFFIDFFLCFSLTSAHEKTPVFSADNGYQLYGCAVSLKTGVFVDVYASFSAKLSSHHGLRPM
jgi:hypothetical protein